MPVTQHFWTRPRSYRVRRTSPFGVNTRLWPPELSQPCNCRELFQLLSKLHLQRWWMDLQRHWLCWPLNSPTPMDLKTFTSWKHVLRYRKSTPLVKTNGCWPVGGGDGRSCWKPPSNCLHHVEMKAKERIYFFSLLPTDDGTVQVVFHVNHSGSPPN